MIFCICILQRFAPVIDQGPFIETRQKIDLNFKRFLLPALFTRGLPQFSFKKMQKVKIAIFVADNKEFNDNKNTMSCISISQVQ